MTRITCLWCGEAATVVKPNARFCSSQHRTEFHSACAAYGQFVFAAGLVNIDTLRGLKGRVRAVNGKGEAETSSHEGVTGNVEASAC